MKDRQTRNVRSASSVKMKHKRSERDKTLNSIRKIQEQHKEREINMFDFLFSFGVLC